MSEQILKYPGGKRNIVDELIKYVPEHKIYLEPFLVEEHCFLLRILQLLKRSMI